jgi:protein SCO1/2
MKINSTRALIILSLSILIVIGLLLSNIINKNVQTEYSSTTKLGIPFELTDSNGNKITEKAFIGSPTALFFGFAYCPDVCPLTLHRISLLMEKLGNKQNKLNVYFITLDPERDTWKFLNEYLTTFNDRIVGITGESKKIKALAKSWGIHSKKVSSEGENYLIDHTGLIILLDKNGNFLNTIDYKDDFELSLKVIKSIL